MTKKTLDLFMAALSVLLLSACSLGAAEQNPSSYQSSSTDSSTADIQITFWAKMPGIIPDEDKINLVIIDEVTGLPYNQTRVEMAPLGDGFFGVILNAKQNSVIKYYYERVSSGANIPESALNGINIRYRLFAVNGPGETNDLVASWADGIPGNTPAGRIEGVVLDASGNLPLADILVTAGGLQTLTDGNGRFTLYPLLPGKHTLVAYAMNGSHHVFQQEAIVVAEGATPTELRMQPSTWVNVTFIVSAPASTIDGAVMRMAGNLTQFGNTYSDLGAGISVDVSQMPVLAFNGDNYYSIKINLPTETEILYKYTLGDGFWNCEHDRNGNFFTHRLYIPAVTEPILIQDKIATWKTSQSADLWFSVTAPANTPDGDKVNIQFQLANWMPGLPMYEIGENQWVYPLISPQNFAGEIAYRYCRNGQCSGILTSGAENSGPVRQTLTRFNETTLQNDEILSWTDFEQQNVSTTTPGGISARDEGFVTGVIFSPYYAPTWDAFINNAIADIRQMDTNLLVVSPSWVAVGPELPLLFSPQPGSSPRWYRTAVNIEKIHDQGLQAGLFPQMRFTSTATNWWRAADTGNENWWLAFFQQYRSFIVQYAKMAEVTEAELLILGGDWVLPSLPIEDNTTTYSLPGNVEELWLQTIEEVRQVYRGQIAWHLPVSMLDQAPLSLLAGVDQIYLQWDAPLTTQSGATIEEMSSQATVLMELYIQPFYEMVNKPVVLSLAYPSAVGSELYCIPTSPSDPTCLDPTPLLQGPVESIDAQTALQLQADLYTAVLLSMEYQDWIAGVVTQGWYPPMELHDTSASVHGKPAQEVLTHWFGLFLGK